MVMTPTPVVLSAWQLAEARARCAGSPAVVADLTFARFAPSAEAAGWVAARFAGMALVWMRAAACAFTASASWRDRYGVTSLAATVRALSRRQLSRVGA
jgi:hypothetical protein